MFKFLRRRRHSRGFSRPSRSSRRSWFSRLLHRVVRFLRAPLRFGFDGLRQFLWFSVLPIVFVFAWFIKNWSRRRGKHLLQGLPSLLVGLTAVALVVLVQARADEVRDDYHSTAARAFRDEDYKTARLMYERIIDLEGPRDVNQFNLALTLLNEEKQERAQAILSKLAPLEKPGMGRAHLWIADRLLDMKQSIPMDARERVELAVTHLQHARARFPESATIDFRLSQCYWTLGAPTAALECLERAAAKQPEFNLELYRVNLALQRTALARQNAVDAERYYSQRIASHPADASARVRWADLRGELGDWDSARRILEEGMATNPDGRFDKAVAMACIGQFRDLAQQPSANSGVLFGLLVKALEYDPECKAALEELAQFGIGERDQEVEALLEQLLVQGEVSAYVHFAMGVRAWKKDDRDGAMFHLERAFRLDDSLAATANNLAYLLCFQKEPDLERALNLINAVLEKHPDDPAYRDTRGQIFVKMERWQDALDDLEAALKELGDDRQLHVALAETYRALGQDRLADRHQSIADGL